MSDLVSILRKILDAVVQVQNADYGAIRLLGATNSSLEVVPHEAPWSEAFDELRRIEIQCLVEGSLLARPARSVLDDVTSASDVPLHRAITAAGFRAMQSTPLLRRDGGAPLGVISTYFRHPRALSAHELQLTDCCAAHACDVIAFKQVEEPLRRSEERLQAAVDLLGLGLYAWDPQTNDLVWDERVKAIWGLPPEAPIDYGVWRKHVHPDDLTRVEEAIERCADPAGDGVYEIEYRINGADGAQRWVATRGRTSFENGKPINFLGVALDITERKQAEDRLRDREAQLAAILQQLPLGVGLVDREGRFLLRGGLLGDLWDPVMPSRDPGQNRRWRSYDGDGQLLRPHDYPGARALRGETVLPGTDFIHTADDGGETWIRVTAAPFRNAAGAIEGAVAITQDVDLEKRTAQAMRESEERFRHFAEYSSNVLWILDTEKERLDYLSPAYDQVWGRSRNAALAYWTETIHADDRQLASAGLERALLGKLVVHEYRIVRPDGSVRRIREIMFPIGDQNGHVKRVGGIAEDITSERGSLVYVVDGAPAAQRSLAEFLQSAGYSVKAFNSTSEFLKVASALTQGCVVLDIRQSEAEGLEGLRTLKAGANNLPVIVTGQSRGGVALAVQVMKAGAVDWLEAPCREETLLMAVGSALAEIRHTAEQNRDAEFARARIAEMSDREQQVLEGLLGGGTNKVIARNLGISPRTVELHRASVMERLGANTLPEAILLAAAAGLRPAQDHSRPRRIP
jgi:PAS domain S-box-containing protein